MLPAWDAAVMVMGDMEETKRKKKVIRDILKKNSRMMIRRAGNNKIFPAI